VLDRQTRRRFPFIERIFADGGYQGPRAATAAARTGSWKLQIVKRRDAAIGFEIIPKRWIVERTFHGSADAGDWRETSNASQEPPPPSSVSP